MAFEPRHYLSLCCATGWLAGVWLAAQVDLALGVWLAAAGVALVGAVAAWRKGAVGLGFAAVAAFTFGAARMTLALPGDQTGTIRPLATGQTVTAYGYIEVEPEARDRSTNLRVAVEELVIDGHSHPVEGVILVQTNRYPERRLGEPLRLSGELTSLVTLENEGYVAYLERQGIEAHMRYPAVTTLPGDRTTMLDRVLLGIKDHAQAIIERSVPEPQAALLVGILLGDDSGMAPDMVEAFRTTGMTHIIAISGFNIALLVALLDALSKPILPRRSAALLIAVVVGLYAVMVGAAGSVVRAAVMGVVYLFSMRLLGRPTYVLASLLVAAALMTAVDPLAIMDVGFQLSLAATLGLVLYAGPWMRWLEDRLDGRLSPTTGRQVTNVLGDGLVVTLAAQVLALPLILYYFGQLALVNLPANMLVLPAQPGVMMTGGMTVLAGTVSEALGQAMGWVAWLFLAYSTTVIDLLARVSWASVPFQLSGGSLAAVYVAIGLVTLVVRLSPSDEAPPDNRPARWIRSERPVLLSVAVASLALSAVLLGSRPDGNLHVSFLDVGQGDAILIQSPTGRQVLVDGGRYPNVLLAELGRQIPFWDRSLDVVVATHADDDHVGGLVEVVERYRVDHLLTNGLEPLSDPAFDALLLTARERGVTLATAQAGQRITIDDGVVLEVLHPAPGFWADSPNEMSVVLRVTFGNLSVLLTGDAESAAEAALLAGAPDLSSAVLKAGHHGANSSSSEAFLGAVKPMVVVVSAGRDNSYGHPHPAALERFAAGGASVLRTDKQGTLTLSSDGRSMWWQTTD